MNHSLKPCELPLVVKLGGSLYDRIPELVPILRTSPRPLFIVPGGGVFADRIREANLPDDESHWLAIEAMETIARYLGTRGLPVTDELIVPDETVVFLPFRCLRERDPLPHTWDVTSDTIAAWIARMLGLDLVILKSVDGIMNGSRFMQEVTKPMNTDVVDPCCIPYLLRHRIRAVIINGRRPDIVERFLLGEPVRSTRIGTTF